jgi:hypothetical protein
MNAPRLIVIDNDRPEIFSGNVGWKMQLVGFAAIERIAIFILNDPRILRALAQHLIVHRGRNAAGEVEEIDRAVQVADAG